MTLEKCGLAVPHTVPAEHGVLSTHSTPLSWQPSHATNGWVHHVQYLKPMDNFYETSVHSVCLLMYLCHPDVKQKLSTGVTLQELWTPPCFNMYLVINKCIAVLILQNLSHHYLHNCSTLDTGIFCYIDVVSPKEHSKKVWQIPPEYTVYCLNEKQNNHGAENVMQGSCSDLFQPSYHIFIQRLTKITKHLSQYNPNEQK
jgi:hypothetical protein